jgi:hypothetical protein
VGASRAVPVPFLHEEEDAKEKRDYEGKRV